MSERRACRVIGTDRTSVRYRGVRPDDVALRERLELRAASAGFAQVLIGPADSPVSTGANEAGCAEPMIEVEFAGKARVRIPGSIPAELAAVVVKALARR